MIKKVIIFVFLLCFLISADGLTADNPIGRIIAIDGKAKVAGSDGAERELALKSDIFLNDRIVTGAGSKLQIRFNDDSMISQGEKSEMTVDQYVYNPVEKKDVNCSIKMVKGVFRSVTGKITEMNPDRFKVKTRMATIGIRGCALGFRLRDDKEDIYVIDLPAGDTIVIEKLVADEMGKGGMIAAADRILTIVNSSVAVTISPSVGLVERPISPAESHQLMNDATPDKSASETTEVVKNEPDSGGSMKDSVNAAVATSEQTVQGQQLLAQATATPVKEQDSGRRSGQEEIPFTQPTEAPYVPPPNRPPPAIPNPGMPFNSWDWGVWADGTVEYKPNVWGYEWLPAAEFQTIVAATASRILTGTGDAGAAVNAPGYSGTLLGVGGVTFEVQVGTSVIPSWGGTFNLTGSGTDRLNFTVDRASGGGKIDANGVLSLNALSSYSLTVNGSTYGIGTLGTHGVNGGLIKASPPEVPDIRGVTGSFNFQHPTPGITVNGAFGADLK